MEDRKKKILMVNGCIRGKESRTWRLAEAFLKPAREAAPRPFDYTQLDLAQMDLKPLTGGFFEERQRFLEKNDRTHPRFDLARQFAQADRILVAAPFWDLSFPALLKIYIENVSVDGITFINSTSQCIQQFYLDHKIFAESFLRWNKTPFDWNGDTLTAHFDADVAVEFEQAGENYRIKNLKAAAS